MWCMSASCLMISKQLLRVSQSGPMDRLHSLETATVFTVKKPHYIELSLHALKEKHGIKNLWNFFQLHTVDGIGGSVKHHVWTTVNTRKVIVNDAPSFVLACNAPKSTVRVIEMSAADIAQRNTTLNLDQVFSDASAIKGILAAHYFHVSNGATVAYPLNKDVSAKGTGSN